LEFFLTLTAASIWLSNTPISKIALLTSLFS
jgi:hypothetical protein